MSFIYNNNYSLFSLEWLYILNHVILTNFNWPKDVPYY